jgi:hypothetical protein
LADNLTRNRQNLTLSEVAFYERIPVLRIPSHRSACRLAENRPLNSADQTYIRSLSSRVQLTANNAQFTYSYGDFRGKPEDVLERCFENQIWEEVDRLIDLKQSKPYDEAVVHLLELRDLAESQGTLIQFQRRIQNIK